MSIEEPDKIDELVKDVVEKAYTCKTCGTYTEEQERLYAYRPSKLRNRTISVFVVFHTTCSVPEGYSTVRP